MVKTACGNFWWLDKTGVFNLHIIGKLKIEWFLGQFQKLGEFGFGIFEDFLGWRTRRIGLEVQLVLVSGLTAEFKENYKLSVN